MMRFTVMSFCYYFFIVISKVFCVEFEQNYTKSQSSANLQNLIISNNFTTVDLELLLDIWNPKKMVKLWTSRKLDTLKDISGFCVEDISHYLNGVSIGADWALRMNDASGRRTSGFFSGNKFWIGAFDQCRQLETEFTINNDLLKKNDNTLKLDNLVPFAVAVNAANLEIQLIGIDLIDHVRTVTLGICLPATCRTNDIKKLLEFYINNNLQDSNYHEDRHRKIIVNYVRNLSEGYSVWKDSTFHIILGLTVLILLFVILGTSYDIALRYKYLDKLNVVSCNNNTSDIVSHNEISETNKNCNKPLDSNEIFTISKLWAVKEHNGTLDVYNSKTVPKPMSEALLSFSLLLNLSKVLTFDVSHDTLVPIHGLRFISMLWIILVHTCLLTNEISDNNLFQSKVQSNFFYQTISNGNYAVDTFFFISGCLVSFLYFQTMKKHKLNEKPITRGFIGKIFQFLGLIFYRYFRLTPPYLLVIGIIQMVTKWHRDHSMVEMPSLDAQNCEKYWWRNALYINTYFAMDERCMVWSWYLANDTQFYAFGILILIIGESVFILGAAFGAIILFSSWITTAIITWQIEYIPSIQDPFAHYSSLYDKPWIRIGPYLIGMATGWYLHNIDCKLKINKSILIVGWSMSILTLLSIVYGLYGQTLGPFLSVMYTTFSHSGWAISIAWILTVCVTNNGGFVAKILSWKYLYPLSRLTYCAYLIHPILTRTIILRGESTLHLSEELIAMLFLGITITSYMLSLFLSLLYEAPMVSLLRIVHPVRQWKYKNHSNLTKKNMNKHEI